MLDRSKPAQQNAHAEENVRAPIPQKQEVLIEHDSYLMASQRKRKRQSNPNSVFDKFRDFQAEASKYWNNFLAVMDFLLIIIT